MIDSYMQSSVHRIYKGNDQNCKIYHPNPHILGVGNPIQIWEYVTQVNWMIAERYNTCSIKTAEQKGERIYLVEAAFLVANSRKPQ